MVRNAMHHPPTPSSEEEGELQAPPEAPSSLEEGVGGGGVSRNILLERAAAMRKNPTEPEKRLWAALRRKELQGHKFRRQAIIGNRIVDFFCPAKGVVIEVDGQTHDPERDAARDQLLMGREGFYTLRFRNEDVMENLQGVLVAIAAALETAQNRWSESLPS